MARPEDPRPSSHGPAFATTDWSLVLAAQGADSGAASSALETLLRVYQRPLRAFLRRKGHAHHDAEDLLQGFLEHILRSQAFLTVDRRRGRLRSFLLGSLENFVRNDHKRSHAAKRGGGNGHVSLELAQNESAEPLIAAADLPPECRFDREWAQTLFDHAVSRLEKEFADDGKAAQFSALAPFLSRPPGPGEYERVAAAIGVRAGLMPTLVSRVRRRFRDLVRSGVAATVATTAEVDAELAYLVELLAL